MKRIRLERSCSLLCPRFPQESSVTLWIELLHSERGGRQGGRELKGAVSVSGLLTTVLSLLSRDCCEVLPLFSHIKYKLSGNG